MAEDNTLAIPAKKREEYVPSVRVVTETGEVTVPVNSESNRLMNQVAASELRDFLSKQIKKYKDDDKKLKPSELKNLVEAWALVEENARFAYAPGLAPSESGENANTPAQMVKAMAEGMVTAQMKESGRMEKILSVGKAKAVEAPIEIKATS